MAHIHEQPLQYDHVVGLFIVKEQLNQSKILLHRHRRLGKWFHPGGHVELHEHPWQTASHELAEETGYSLQQLQVLQRGEPLIELQEVLHPTPLLYRSHRYGNTEPPHFHSEATFALLALEEPANSPAQGESQALQWFTREELLTIAPEEINGDVRRIALMVLENYAQWHRVPASSYALEQPQAL